MKLLCSIFVIISSIGLAFAAEDKLSVTDAWARPVILENRPGAAYFIIQNNSSLDDKLIKATSELAARIELHKVENVAGIMKMSQTVDIPVAANSKTEVRPGGYHLMLFGLTEKLAVGGALPLTLTFEHAGEVKITAHIMKKAP